MMILDGEMMYKAYKKDMPHSYCLGAFPTMEMIDAQPQHVIEVLYAPTFCKSDAYETLVSKCRNAGITLRESQAELTRLSPKENCFVGGVFEKYANALSTSRAHIVLVSPENMGNLGTIIRSAVGFSCPDIAIIRPAADVFDPKAIRASMGSLFRARIALFDEFSDYQAAFPSHALYPFMLQSTHTLDALPPPSLPYSLVFGSESSGLAPSFLTLGTSVRIPHADTIDSLNLPLAVGIALWATASTRG